MRNILFITLFAALLTFGCQKEATPPQAFGAVPNEEQLAWHELEQYAFIHFGINTFNGKGWGYGDEAESTFAPTALDVEQWAKVVKDAGLKGIVLTCKHHDGFCLWPSAYTDYSVKNSPFKDGKGDVVKEVSDACRKYGLFFGVYLSPWDRHHAQYGSPEYIAYYRNQLTELLSNYGEVQEIWFDGANGGDGYYGGARENRKIDQRTYYDWPETYKLIRKLSPRTIIFSNFGPDIRWCGNENGYIGSTNWCLMNSSDSIYPSKPGSHELLNVGSENGDLWLPAEVDVPNRPGWFYFDSEDDKVKSPETLFKIYLESVGRGACLLLNLPPDRRGLIHENDVKALQGWKKLLDETFATNLAANAKAKADTWRGNDKTYSAEKVTDGDKETYWATDDEVTTGSIEIAVPKAKKLKYILLQEYIRLGQRVRSFTVEAKKDGKWENVVEATTIGHKRILPLGDIEASAIRVNITDAKACPLISAIELY